MKADAPSSSPQDDRTGARGALSRAAADYERAFAVSLEAGRQSAEAYRDRLAVIAVAEGQEAHARELAERRSADESAADAKRTEKLARRAAKLEDVTLTLLRRAGLERKIQARDAGITSADPPTLERTTAAFAAAQAAADDVLAGLVRLAEAHATRKEWEQARRLLVAIKAELPAPLSDHANGLICLSCLGQAESAWLAGDWQRTDDMVAKAAAEVPDGKSIDAELTELILKTNSELVARAIAAGRASVLGGLASVARRLGRPDPQISRLAQREPWIGWICGQALLLRELDGHTMPVQDVAVTRDGNNVVSADGLDVMTWRIGGASDGELLSSVRIPGAYWLAPNGLVVATVTGELHSTRDGSLLGRLTEEPGRRVAFASFSADGSVCAAAARERNPSLHVTLIGEPEFHAPEDTGDVLLWMRLTALADERRKFTGAVIRGNYTSRPSYNQPGKRPAAVHSIDSILVTARDRKGPGVTIGVMPGQLSIELRLSPDGSRLAYLGQNTGVRLAEVAPDRVPSVLRTEPFETPFEYLAFSPRGDLLASPSNLFQKEPRLTAWDPRTGQQAWFAALPATAAALAFSGDSRMVATIDYEGMIALLDVARQEIVASPGSHGPVPFACLVFSRDDRKLITSGDRTVKVWGFPNPA